MHGVDHGAGTGLPILGSRATQVGSVHDLGVYGFLLCHCLPMVFLGLFIGFQLDGYKWVYRGFGTLRFDERAGYAISRIAVDS